MFGPRLNVNCLQISLPTQVRLLLTFSFWRFYRYKVIFIGIRLFFYRYKVLYSHFKCEGYNSHFKLSYQPS